AAIVFRKGDKLYLVTVAPDQKSYGSDRRDYGSDRRDYATDRRNCDPLDSGNRQDCERRDYGSDRRDYGSDRRDYGSDRDESASPAQAERDWREYQQSLRQNRNQRDYGTDRYAGEPDQPRVYVNDPDYAQYRLRKLFDENWTTSDTTR